MFSGEPKFEDRQIDRFLQWEPFPDAIYLACGQDARVDREGESPELEPQVAIEGTG